MLGGRYELGAPLGSGGFGTVFRARDRRTGAELAIKWVLPGLGADAAAERLRHEGAVLRTVVSRRVAQVFDLGDDEHGVWLVTALVEGGPLATATLGRALLPHEVLRVARGLLEGLADFITVTDAEIAEAVRVILQTTHHLVEGAGAMGLAAAMRLGPTLAGQRVGIVFCGANMDSAVLRRILNHEL